MNKEFNFAIIPIGEAKWHYLLPKLFLTARVSDNNYKCLRLIDSLYSESINRDESLPTFVPNEPIRLENGNRFKVVVSYPIKNNKLNQKILTPWYDEEIQYNEAKWIAAEKIIKEYSQYVILYIEKDYKITNNDMDKIMDICDDNGKPYMVCSDDKEYTYDDLYNYFFK